MDWMDWMDLWTNLCYQHCSAVPITTFVIGPTSWSKQNIFQQVYFIVNKSESISAILVLLQQRCIQRFPTQSIQEFLEISRKFSRNFTSRSRSRGIFNSLFTLDLDFETFSFHFSLSISISRHFHFTFHSRNE